MSAVASVAPAVAPAEAPRVDALDVVRGLVMVVMALDHVRAYTSNVPFDPTDMSRTWPALFFARWITHICAPAFSFFAGTAAFLSLSRGRTTESAARFLATRGVFLILLEVFVLRFVWFFNLWPIAVLVTLWALGTAMLFLAFLLRLRLSSRAIGAIGCVLVAGHNLLDPLDEAGMTGFTGTLWKLLHVESILPIGTAPPGFPLPGAFNVVVGYPILPWLGVMALGYAFGAVLVRPREERRAVTLGLGFAATVAFVLLRLSNAYGDPRPWGPQGDGAMTLVSFFNTTKYPPSLCFLLMTLGPVLMLFAWADRPPGAFGRFLSVYGRVPMFFYVVHIALAHLLSVAVAVVQAGGFKGPGVEWAAFRSPDFVVPPPAGFGLALPGVYALWLGLVLALYGPCVRYGAYKRTSRSVVARYI